MIKKCVILIILDSVGVGELPDAQMYGDKGSNTLKNLAEKVGGISLPNLEKMGLGLIGKFKGIKEVNNPTASFGRMAEASSGKDTTTGHWEITGLILDKPFPTYPNGFPSSIIESFKKQIGKDILGNIPASGTEIIEQLGEKHMETGYPIIYTSADSVFQIAAHEEVIPVEELYEMCLAARHILKEPDNVSRVIARPFIGKPGSFQRTERRKDFSVLPPRKTLLDLLKEKNIPVIGIGKIEDIFAGRGLTESIHTKNNVDGFNRLVEVVKKIDEGFVFINLVDFDMLYGHRNNAEGYAEALQEFDQRLPELLDILGNDILIITADHGCDPTTISTDHSREYVPLLITGNELKTGVNLGIRKTFADLGQTIADIFEIDKLENGESFLESLKIL